MAVKIGKKDIAFIKRGNEILQPDPVRDGLVLWYDFMGRMNSDTKRGIAEDLSGNGNDGRMVNFAYQEGSGYTSEGLLEDLIDDYIVRPFLELDERDFSVSVGETTYSYSGEVVTFNDGSEIKEAKINLLRNSGLFPNRQGWGGVFTFTHSEGSKVITTEKATAYPVMRHALTLKPNTTYVCTACFMLDEEYPITSGTPNHLYAAEPGGTNISGFKDPLIKLLDDDFNKANEWTSVPILFNTTEKEGILFSFHLYAGTRQLVKKLKYVVLTEGDSIEEWTPNPKDIVEATTTLNPSFFKSFKIYNRALTPEEIAHNYAIEKGRWNL